MTSTAATASQGPLWAPWHVLLHWTPFKIDALGLVTLLGAEEINAAVGRLVSSGYLEYLPLLGAYVIAGDRFTEKVAGWNLYNISQGIHTTDLAAWLTRWMLSQDFETTRSYVVWKVTAPRSRRNDLVISFLVGFVLNGFLVAGTIISADWYGLANALAMIISIIVRVYVIGQQRLAVDAMVDEAVTKIDPAPPDSYEARRHDYKAWIQAKREQKSGGRSTTRETQSTRSSASSPMNGQETPAQHVQPVRPPTKPDPRKSRDEVWTGKTIKVLIIQSDSKAVTFQMPNELVMPRSLFIEGPIILNPKTYFIMRSIGWLAFAVHIVAIGMADLATQLYTVVLIVLPTLLLVKKTGCDDSDWVTTFRSWKSSIFGTPNQSGSSGKPRSADDSGDVAQLRFVRQCWIGSRLKAEVYEWPDSYEFHKEVKDDDKIWVSGPPKAGQERSKRRQDLYAWLALSRDEEESMDKWDLFPHIRNDNYSWWRAYKQKKHALFGKSVAGLPQHLDEPETKKTGSQSPQDQNPKPFHSKARNRTATINFVHLPGQCHTGSGQNPEARQGSAGPAGSSAFPAISAHDLEETHDDAIPQLAGGVAAADFDGSNASAGLPRVDTQSRMTGSSHIDPSAGLTQSPAVMNATDNQP